MGQLGSKLQKLETVALIFIFD
ncbi:hypothetical protein CY0110_19122 [Crocosphaera chwakensis CCY0110]|uniref:Uncharacterized protein n=1 Tax=Crocosphaera chwakensis CCY0110 TaxID=391612 RepID=A3IJF6_9CHRO|nr:hypothetical protein CY0110_19122 [Crocosphaera chwakensis CCY0110]